VTDTLDNSEDSFIVDMGSASKGLHFTPREAAEEMIYFMNYRLSCENMLGLEIGHSREGFQVRNDILDILKRILLAERK
jgi:hypothetical protein